MGIFSLFKNVFREYRGALVLLVLLGFVGAALDGIGINLVVPFIAFLTGGAASLPTDIITRTIQHAFALFHVPFQFRYLLVLMAGIFFLRAAALVAFAYVRARIGAHFMEREMGGLFKGTLEANWLFLIKQKSGYLQNTIFWDVKRAANLLDVVAQALQSWSGCLVYIAVALNISPLITSVTLFAGLIFVAFFRPLLRRSQQLAQVTSTTEKSFSQHLIEAIMGLKSVKAAAVEGVVYQEGQQQLTTLQEAYARSGLVQSLGTVLIQPFSFLFLLAMFALTYSTGTFNLAAFAATFYLIQKIFTYLQSGQASLHSIQELRPFAENMVQFKQTLSDESEGGAHGKPFSFEKEIVFQDVALKYEEENGPVFSHLSFRIPQGGVVALVGPSGGGKTSIADLLLRLFEPTEGSITVDGVPAQDIDRADWRAHIGYVTQDAFLINASIADNIRFHRSGISREAMERAAQQANIQEFINSLPDGYDTMLGDRGMLVSGGQRQRIALARALAGEPAILVLDEATSALDTEAERLIHEAIAALRGSVSVFVIAHRLTTIEDADMVFVLEKGAITESGAPQELLANPDSYLSRHHT